jgi:hypothetical protein
MKLLNETNMRNLILFDKNFIIMIVSVVIIDVWIICWESLFIKLFLILWSSKIMMMIADNNNDDNEDKRKFCKIDDYFFDVWEMSCKSVSDEFDLRMWCCRWWSDDERMKSLLVVDLKNKFLFELIHYVLDVFHLCCVYSLIVMIVSLCSLHSILNFWATCSFYLDNSFCQNFFYFVYVLRVILNVLNKIWFELFSFVWVIFWWSAFQMNDWDYWMYFSCDENFQSVC